jgi:multidrug efflux pump subunit AcrA (membrane-fusion protein)
MGSPVVEAARIGAPVGILVAGVVAFVVLRSLKEEPQRTLERVEAPLVETVAVELHKGGLDFSVDGVVVPYREIDLSAEVSGRIARRAEICRAGKYVSRGTPLIEIDDRDYKLEVERLTRELAQAAVSLKELDVEVANTQALAKLAREQLALYRKELKRNQELAGKRVVSDTDLDKAKREELAGVNSLLTLENQLLLLQTRRNRLESARDLWQSQLAKAQLDLSRTKVSAPIDGVVAQEMVEEDSYVQKGTSLVKLVDTSAVEVRCNLQMQDLYWLWSQTAADDKNEAGSPTHDYQIPPAPVTVQYELSGRRYQWAGVLSRFEGIGVDEKTRTVPCRVLVDKPREVRVDGADATAGDLVGPPALVRGMFVTVRVHAQPQVRLLRIPQRAIQPGSTVWQVTDGRLAIRRIRIADTAEGLALVYADGAQLEPGTKLVCSPLALATEGMAVRERAPQ